MSSRERVFVVGGTGAAGGAYARALTARGYEVRATARDKHGADALAELGVTPVALDAADAGATAEAMVGVDAVIVTLLGRGSKQPPRKRGSPERDRGRGSRRRQAPRLHVGPHGPSCHWRASLRGEGKVGALPR